MRDDSPIDIVFQLDSHIIFRVSSFQITQVGDPMEKREVVDDRVEIQMVVLCIAWDVEVSNPDRGVTAEHENGLSLVRMLRQVTDDLTCGYGHFFDILLTEIVGLPDV